ncbi:helix-turn-helix domain-containing protein [Microgenomates group bacterium]|nr:helix-turn-helix domain-containing protein [Microgenomates group bacterium]
MLQAQVYTPDQVAKILQLNKNTVYELIKRGEIVAKKIGKVFRIPAIALSFATTGLDNDLYEAERKDLKLQPTIMKELRQARKAL